MERDEFRDLAVRDQSEVEGIKRGVADSRLYNEDLAPNGPEDRTWSTYNILALWVGGMVGNHVAALVSRYGESGEVPEALTEYIKRREGYDYGHHGRAGNPSTEFVPDEIVDRFCVLGTPEQHVEKLNTLKALSVDQFNVYLMHDAMQETLEAYGEIIASLQAGATA